MNAGRTSAPAHQPGRFERGWKSHEAGRPLAGREHADLAMRLSLLDPLDYAMLATRAFTHMAAGEDAEAAR